MKANNLENMKPVLVQNEFPVFSFTFLIILMGVYLNFETRFNKSAIHKEARARIVEVETFDKELLGEFPNVPDNQLWTVIGIYNVNAPVDLYAGNFCYYGCEAVRDIQREINYLVQLGDSPRSFLNKLLEARVSDIDDQFLVHTDYKVRVKRLSRYVQDERRKILWKYKDLKEKISQMGSMDRYFLSWSLDLAYINVDESIVDMMARVIASFGKPSDTPSVEDLRFVIRGRDTPAKEVATSDEKSS